MDQLLELHARHEARMKAMHEAIEEQTKYGATEKEATK